ncbi:DUF2798 domain-containing protein [Candidatus Bathyarchaeota archaeon]|nr:DUF2798 domain-containing protein [Candidatus Bathyarchaeota archaeon]
MKINRKYEMVLFAVFVSMGMSFAMSLVLTIVNLGFVPGFLQKWLSAFAVGFLVSVPASLIIIPVVRIIVGKLTTD